MRIKAFLILAITNLFLAGHLLPSPTSVGAQTTTEESSEHDHAEHDGHDHDHEDHKHDQDGSPETPATDQPGTAPAVEDHSEHDHSEHEHLEATDHDHDHDTGSHASPEPTQEMETDHDHQEPDSHSEHTHEGQSDDHGTDTEEDHGHEHVENHSEPPSPGWQWFPSTTPTPLPATCQSTQSRIQARVLLLESEALSQDASWQAYRRWVTEWIEASENEGWQVQDVYQAVDAADRVAAQLQTAYRERSTALRTLSARACTAGEELQQARIRSRESVGRLVDMQQRAIQAITAISARMAGMALRTVNY